MFVTITLNEIKKGKKGDYLYIKYITSGGKESGKAVFGELREKWELCQNGARLELKLDGAPNYNVVDILPATDEPPPEAEAEAKPEPKTDHMPSGVEVGRAINDICALYTADKLHILFGKENAEAILKWWRQNLQGTLKLPVDGAKLPMWDKQEKGG